MTEMKRKLKIMTHQVDQLKEEISAKESALVKLHLEQQRIEKEKETLKVQIDLTRKARDQQSIYSTHLRQAPPSLKAARGRENTRHGDNELWPLWVTSLRGMLPGGTERRPGDAQALSSPVSANITSAEEELAGRQCPTSPGACRLTTVSFNSQPTSSPCAHTQPSQTPPGAFHKGMLARLFVSLS